MIRTRWHITVVLTLLLCGVAAVGETDRALLPAFPTGKGDRCVEPTDVMRRDHMRFLMHQRDDTVRQGIRGAKHSLVGCIECHVQTDPQGAAIPVNAEGQFCASCHDFAGVRMDCFECHAAVPEAGGKPGDLSRLISQLMSPQLLCRGWSVAPGVN